MNLNTMGWYTRLNHNIENNANDIEGNQWTGNQKEKSRNHEPAVCVVSSCCTSLLESFHVAPNGFLAPPSTLLNAQALLKLQ